MNQVTAKLTGAAKEVRSVLKGDLSIYATLSKEHGEVASLLKQAIETTSESKRNTLISKIRTELLSHAKAEEDSLYAALSHHIETTDQIGESKNEHEEIRRIVDAAARLPAGSTEQSQALHTLQDTVQRHVEEEESYIFGLAHRVLSKEQEQRLDEQFKRMKRCEAERLSE